MRSQASSDVKLSDAALGTRGSAPAARPEADVAALGRILRGIGAAVLLTAASTFLLQRWQTGDDLGRYAGLLALTALLAVAGFATGLRLRETRGARTFLALAAGVVPAHFCILGGFVYSQFAWDAGPRGVASYASWVAPSGAAALLVCAGALAVLAPVTFVSLLALVRSRARSRSAAYLALGSLLLVPTRDPQAVALLVALGAAALVALERRAGGDLALRTFEGLLVRGMLAAPIVLLVLRSLLHYEISSFLASAVCAALALLAFALSREAWLGARWRRAFERAALLPAAGACGFGAAALSAAGLPEVALIPAATLPFAGVLAALSLGREGGGAGTRNAAALVASGGAALELLLFDGAAASLYGLAVSIPVLAFGHAVRGRFVFATGAAVGACSLLHQVIAAIRVFAWWSLGGLALLGAAAIVGASLLERHHRDLAARFDALRDRLSRSSDGA